MNLEHGFNQTHVQYRGPARNMPFLTDSLQSQRRKSPKNKRKHRRFKVRRGMLAVSETFMGQILDISKTGLSFLILHFLKDPGKTPDLFRKISSLDILSSGLTGYILKTIPVISTFDQELGPMFPDRKDIIVFRRGIQIPPFSLEQFEMVQRFIISRTNLS